MCLKEVYGKQVSKLVIRKLGQKVVGQAETHEKEYLIKIIAEDIAANESIMSLEQIIRILRQSNIYFLERLPVFYGAEGCSIGKDIYIDKNFVEFLNNDDILEEIRNLPGYKAIVHECIHRIQSNYAMNGRNKYWGLIEGITESESLTIDGLEQGIIQDDIRYNFAGTVYLPNVAIVRQLERIYGREVMEKLAYNNNKEVVKLLNRDYGDLFTDSLLEALKTVAGGRKDVDTRVLFNIQFRLMAKYFTDRLEKITSIEEAESFLEEFKDYMTDLMYFKDMSKYEELYNKFVDYISSKFSEFDKEKNKYEEPDLYPMGNLDERIYMVDSIIKFSVESDFLSEDIKEVEEQFAAYDPDNYQKYTIIQDNMVFSLLIFPDNRCHLYGLYGSFENVPKGIEGYGKYNPETNKYEIKCFDGRQNINCEFNPETTTLNFDTVLEDIGKASLELEEEPLDFSREELYDVIKERYELGQKIAPLSQKISSKISGEQLFEYEETKSIGK